MRYWGQQLLRPNRPESQKTSDCISDGENERESQQDFDEIDATDSSLADNSNVVSFIMSDHREPSDDRGLGLRGGHMPTYILRQVRSTCCGQQSSTGLGDLEPGCSGSGNRGILIQEARRRLSQIAQSANDADDKHLTAAYQTRLIKSPSDEIEYRKDALECTSSGRRPNSVARRAANRLVSLVDGTVISPRVRCAHRASNSLLIIMPQKTTVAAALLSELAGLGPRPPRICARAG